MDPIVECEVLSEEVLSGRAGPAEVLSAEVLRSKSSTLPFWQKLEIKPKHLRINVHVIVPITPMRMRTTRGSK